MAEHSRFFDSIDPLDPDKVYTAEDFVKYLGGVVTGGIVKGEGNNLKVETSGSNMNVTVDTGMAYLVDRQYENDSKLSLTHEVEALGKSRIDRVVLRLVLDMDARYIKAFVKKGVAGTAPIPPPLERTSDVYEISLAQVKVIGGQTYINVADVTDERGNPDVCPWAGSKILPNFNDAALEDLVLNVGELNTSVSDVENALALKANKKQEIPVNVVFTSGKSSSKTFQYYKDDFGIVHFQGEMDTVGNTLIMFNLPVGYRPQYSIFLPVFGGSQLAGLMTLQNNGTCIFNSVIGSRTDFTVIGTYKAEVL